MTDLTDLKDFEYLNTLYGASEDPWHMRSGWQTERQRDLLLACLPRYGSAFQPGCAAGELTTGLARCTDRILAADEDRPALSKARTRTAHLSNVDVQFLKLPEQWPTGQQFDLIVLHEMGYRLDLANWARLATSVRNSLTPDATVLACHRLHQSQERIPATETLHGTLDSILGLERQTHVADADFVIDVWKNPDIP